MKINKNTLNQRILMVNIMEVYASWHENGNKQNDNAYINGKLCSASILSDEQKIIN